MKRSWLRWIFSLALLVELILIYLFLLWPWMMRWGATDAEVAMSMPGDDLITDLAYQSTRAVTIHAPADEVWRWLVQVGQDRAGFYSEDWLENLFLANIHNANQIQSDWQALQEGGLVRGAPADSYGGLAGSDPGWIVPLLEPGRVLYLWGPILVEPIDEESTRLILRSPIASAGLLALTLNKLVYDPVHFVMERGLMLGIKARAEGNRTPLFWQWLALSGWILATLGLLLLSLQHRRGRWWLALPLLYVTAILWNTRDWRAAMAGFLIFAVPITGFSLYGGRFAPWFAVIVAAVLLVLLLTPSPFTAFGLIFLATSLVVMAWLRFQSSRRAVSPVARTPGTAVP